ncbi:ABC transporter, permease protein [Mobiluncus mulieris 28-1]|uniref:ABC transporter, permease protein n=3 Tax=Mobiluncus mulieris TaxID=2052 RepID=E0QS97_9ACTO|nr:ABC transporter, permease protein [Mobiluncus mulieris ATCC 35243]EEZ91752.1 ABC transporter, permease protein [Mobiluncus mulieris 28-1]EFM45578.1 ABC transporter, permease protein [Mobiluncus mulieris ATCC 35239]EFN93881.1 ABC transporter, permease protein [Mobiluncus mulieris FB024-16]MBB5845860.1 multiple sugar transport system permease protein [Mobiluncus mulieris]
MSDTKQKTANYKEADTRAVKGATNAKKMSWQKRSQAITGWAFMAPFVILFTVVFLVPILVSLYSSFFRLRTVGGGPYGGGEIQNIFVGLENYQYTVASPEFWKGIGRVVLYTCFQVPVMILMALVLALLLDSFLTRHVTIYRLGYFLPFAIPGVVAAMIWLYLYNPEVSPLVQGLHAIGLPVDFFNKNVILASMANMTTWTYTGYNMLIFLAALQAIPAELSEAARIDGASGLQIMTRIKVPMLRGAALLAVLLSIVGTIQLFNEPQVMSSALPWMGKSYTPMMMAYNTTMGTLTPSGDGPGSAVAIVMALIAGVLAVGYFLVDRKVGGND